MKKLLLTLFAAFAVALACCNSVQIDASGRSATSDHPDEEAERKADEAEGLSVSRGALATARAIVPMALTIPRSFKDPAKGFLLGAPLGFTASSSPPIKLQDAGFVPGYHGEMQPQFAALHQDWLLSSNVPAIQAMSIGLDIITVSPLVLKKDMMIDGEPATLDEEVMEFVMGSHMWAAFLFTVDYEQRGPEWGKPGWVADDILALGDKVDASVFNYVVPGSVGDFLPSEGQSVLAKGPEHIGIAPGDEIHGLDMHMALFGTDLGDPPQVFTMREVPNPPDQALTIYFTLRRDFIQKSSNALVALWGFAPDTGTIYKTVYDPTVVPGKSWTKPRVFRTWVDLGITRESNEAVPVIDGLAIDIPGSEDKNQYPEVLFSLAESPANTDVGPAKQIMHVSLGDNPGKPRRVIVRPLPTGSIASLGRAMMAGRGIGDFCVQDPVASWQKQHMNDLVVDDFFIARRWANPILHGPSFCWPKGKVTLDGRFVIPFLSACPPRLDPSFPILPGALPVPDPIRPIPIDVLPDLDRFLLFEPTTLAVSPTTGVAFAVPKLGLTISGYRQCRGHEQPFMRTCMSWPCPTAPVAEACVEWGWMDDYRIPASMHWGLGSANMTYHGGTAVSADLYLPEPKIDETSKRALIARWYLRVAGKTYISPVSALRY